MFEAASQRDPILLPAISLPAVRLRSQGRADTERPEELRNSSVLCELEALAFHRDILREGLGSGRFILGQPFFRVPPQTFSPALPSGAFFSPSL